MCWSGTQTLHFLQIMFFPLIKICWNSWRIHKVSVISSAYWTTRPTAAEVLMENTVYETSLIFWTWCFRNYILDLLEGGRKFLVFAHHKDMLDAICSCLTQKVSSKHFGNSNRHIQDRAYDAILESFGSFSFSFRQKEDKNGWHTTDGIGPPLPVYTTHSPQFLYSLWRKNNDWNVSFGGKTPVNSFDIKFSCFTSSPMQHHSFS